jgi:hypothetical protein
LWELIYDPSSATNNTNPGKQLLMRSNDERGRLANIRLFRFGQSQMEASAVYHRWWKALGILVFYLLLALAMLSPLAANAMPDSPAQDLANHVSGIIEGRNALAEGQFPIRVAPRLNNSERYPIFQFYGNLPYTAGGLFYLAADINPYLVWKVIVLSVMVIGACFIYQCAMLMTRRTLPSLAGGMVFLTAPYMLTDIHSRFAYPEIVSFGILPCVLFYTMRSIASRRPIYILLNAVAWSCLALSHNITFLYASMFFSLYLLTFARFNTKYLWRMIRVGLGYSVGVLLTAWYIVPQLYLLPNLAINLSLSIQTPFRVAWLTPLHVLLAPTLVSPTPPDPEIILPPRFGLQVGWPILIAFGLMFFYLYSPAHLIQRSRVMIARLLLFFLLTFFMVWSPVDFWSYLPKIFNYVQFSYRLLMFIILWGSLLAAYALTYTFRRRMRFKHITTVSIILLLLTTPYLAPHTPSNRVSVDSEILAPNMGRAGASYAYLLSPSAMVATTIFHQDVNLADWDYDIVELGRNLLYPGDGEIPAPKKGDSLIIRGEVPDEYVTPVKLTVILDNMVVVSTLLGPGMFRLVLPITTTFMSDRAHIVIQTDRYLDPVRRVPALPEPGMLALEINALRLRGSPARANDVPLLSVIETSKTISIESPTTYVIQNRETRLVQLPVLFYPNMVQIRDNGRIINYGNLGRSVVLLLPSGDHVITAHFVGVGWANILSLLAWIGVLLTFIFMVIRYYLRNRPKAIVFG